MLLCLLGYDGAHWIFAALAALVSTAIDVATGFGSEN
jgi:hypothetical protein